MVLTVLTQIHSSVGSVLAVNTEKDKRIRHKTFTRQIRYFPKYDTYVDSMTADTK